MASTTIINSLLGSHPSGDALKTFIDAVANDAKHVGSTATIKSYPDVVYYNYHALGLSLQFKPVEGYKPGSGSPDESRLVLDCVDFYNSGDTHGFSCYPSSPIRVLVRNQVFPLELSATGKELVAKLGEPDRKGGGGGPSTGSINIWVEWVHGIQIEFRKTGPNAWDNPEDTPSVITITNPSLGT